MFPLSITTVRDEKDLRLLNEFMLKQSQYYPGHREWVDGKCSTRIEKGKYKPIIAISDGRVVGDVVYHVLPNGTAEIKNFRIDEQYRNRDLGHFLLTQAEVESSSSRLALDVTVNNFLGVQFFIRNGFNIVGTDRLYLPTQLEYLMEKEVRKRA
jgi:ribosomal protein S18 acetylase RimI-like enzyme